MSDRPKGPGTGRRDRPRRAAGAPGKVRIIGGRWRGRRLAVAGGDALRPTPDRVRETLFNWLMPVLPGARCLDLFAGTGALGFEAASRGAARVVLVERDPQAVEHLHADRLRLAAGDEIQVVRADAIEYLRGPPEPFDVVFVDPPYGEALLPTLCPLLDQGGWLAPNALLYLESRARGPEPNLPQGWEVLREGRAGQVRYRLARAEART